ncbi:MAG: hypothetical protein KDI13_05580 [Alphaproteobacteria bacterium]|nr:hypothetical protein [Alphaproteobacteria bacterium]
MLLEEQVQAFRLRHSDLCTVLDARAATEQHERLIDDLARQFDPSIDHKLVLSLLSIHAFPGQNSTRFRQSCDFVRDFLVDSVSSWDGTAVHNERIWKDVGFVLDYVRDMNPVHSVFVDSIERYLSSSLGEMPISRQKFLPVPVSLAFQEQQPFTFIGQHRQRNHRKHPSCYSFNDHGRTVHYSRDVTETLANDRKDPRREAAAMAVPDLVKPQVD